MCSKNIVFSCFSKNSEKWRVCVCARVLVKNRRHDIPAQWCKSSRPPGLGCLRWRHAPCSCRHFPLVCLVRKLTQLRHTCHEHVEPLHTFSTFSHSTRSPTPTSPHPVTCQPCWARRCVGGGVAAATSARPLGQIGGHLFFFFFLVCQRKTSD